MNWAELPMVKAVERDGKSKSCARWSLLKVLAPARGATSDCSPQYNVRIIIPSLELIFLFRTVEHPPLFNNQEFPGNKLNLIHLLLIYTMELPPLTTEQLSQLVASNAPPSQLFAALSRYEQAAYFMCAGSGSSEIGGGNPVLLSLFYSSFFLAHLLTDQMSVVQCNYYL